MIGKKQLRVPDYIAHIIEAINRIEEYAANIDQKSFIENSLVQDAVIRNFEVIGEAAHKISTVDSTFVENYATKEEAKRDLFQYIEGYYNRQRIHSSINYLTPEQMELKAS